MPPKRKMSDVNNVSGSAKAVKREKKVMTLLQKVEVLDKLASGMGASVVGRLFSVNESTVRYIKKKEKLIRESVGQSVSASAKVACVVRDRALVKMEKALSLWIEDMSQKNEPVDQNMIREKALVLYEQYRQAGGSAGSSDEAVQQTFNASKGWFEKFKKRVALHNIKATYIKTVHRQIFIRVHGFICCSLSSQERIPHAHCVYFKI
jgi:DNA topoisomerase IB